MIRLVLYCIFLYVFSFCFAQIKYFGSDKELLLSRNLSASVSRTSPHCRIPRFWLSATKIHAPKSSRLLRTPWLHFEQGLPSCPLRNTHNLIADILRYFTTADPLHYSRGLSHSLHKSNAGNSVVRWSLAVLLSLKKIGGKKKHDIVVPTSTIFTFWRKVMLLTFKSWNESSVTSRWQSSPSTLWWPCLPGLLCPKL